MSNNSDETTASLSERVQLAKERGPAAMIAARNGATTRVAFDADPVTFATLQTLRTGYHILMRRRVSTTLLLRRAVQLLAADLAQALTDPEAAAAQMCALEDVRD